MTTAGTPSVAPVRGLVTDRAVDPNLPGPRIRRVAIVVADGVEPFGLGAACEIWAESYHPEENNPVFDVRVVTPRPGRVRGSSGFDLHVEHGLEWTDRADLVIVTAIADFEHPEPVVVRAVSRAHARGAWIFSACSASWTLALAGLLDGRSATTHWRYAQRMAAAFPSVDVQPDVLFVQSGRVITGAGSAAGLDAGLHLLREQYGAKVAGDAARRMVVAPHREGGQAQFINRPVPVACESETLAPLLAWIEDHLTAELSVEELAARVHLAPRTFARKFKDATGQTPYQWVLHRRVQRAEEYLERTDHPVEHIAACVGFGSAAALRQHFSRVRGVSPQTYRRTFTLSS